MYAHCEIINKICFYNKDPTRFVSTHTTGQIKLWHIDHKLKKVFSDPQLAPYDASKHRSS